MNTIKLRSTTVSPAQENDRSSSSSPTYTKTREAIIFKHPAYPDDYGQNLLLQLYAWDTPGGGLHTGTALLACALVACNSQDGYLTVDRDGDRLDARDDEILPAGEYYYHVANPDPPSQGTTGRSHYKYPVYPSFEHWAFPHGNIPARWLRASGGGVGQAELEESSSTPSVSSVSAAVIARDRACAISKHRDYIERAHLCPRNELDWFQKNGMRRYNARRDISGDLITDDMANAIAMRADIHRAFDDCKFAIVRKDGQWVAHFLETTYELGRMYHNRPVEIRAGISVEFLLARFAWAIFPLVKAFMEQGPERLVKLREKSSDGFHEVIKTLDPTEFAQLGTGRGRSKSPKKRKASDSNLASIVEAKRHCLSPHPDHSSQLETGWSDSCQVTSEQRMPSLSSSDGDGAESEEEEEEESREDRIAAFRTRELRKRRPIYDPELLCCDYTLAERRNALGLFGKPEYGGGHLCMACLGSEEFRDDGVNIDIGDPT